MNHTGTASLGWALQARTKRESGADILFQFSILRWGGGQSGIQGGIKGGPSGRDPLQEMEVDFDGDLNRYGDAVFFARLEPPGLYGFDSFFVEA